MHARDRNAGLTLSQEEVSVIRPLIVFRPSVVAQPAAADVTPVIIAMLMGSRRFSSLPDAEVSLWSTGAAVAARKKVAAVKKRILRLKWVGRGCRCAMRAEGFFWSSA